MTTYTKFTFSEFRVCARAWFAFGAGYKLGERYKLGELEERRIKPASIGGITRISSLHPAPPARQCAS